MQVGVPGSGLGYAFYALSVACMPIHELSRLARGKSSIDRWRRVARQVGLLAGIVAGLAGEWWVLTRVQVIAAAIRSAIYGNVTDAEAGAVSAVQHGMVEDYLGPIIVVAPFVIIAVLWVILQLLRLGLRADWAAILRRWSPRPRSQMRQARPAP